MIVRLREGLGNQMFQYAFGRSVSKARNEKLRFKKYRLDRGHQRPYSLGAFNVQIKFTRWVLGPKYQETTHCCFDPGVYEAKAGSYFIGYWQTEKYFDEPLVRRELSLKLPVSGESARVGQLIQNQPSAFIHVRRTDYLHPSNATIFGNMNMDYYNVAITHIKSQVPGVHFFVFSDDPAWCRETFSGGDFTVVGHNTWNRGRRGPGTAHEDLWLMSLCNHAIIPNSTFGWWGAWLNPEKQRIVIAPKHWYLPTSKIDARDIVPDRWTRL